MAKNINTVTSEESIRKYSSIDTSEWTRKTENILHEWKSSANVRKTFHLQSMRRYKIFYYMLSIPSTILSGVVGTALFSVVGGDCNGPTDFVFKLSLAILSSAATIINGLSVGIDFKSKMQDNKDAYDSYDSMIRIIDTTLNLPPRLRGNVLDTLHSIRQFYDRCISNAPELSSEFEDKLKETDEKYTVSILKKRHAKTINDDGTRSLSVGCVIDTHLSIHEDDIKSPTPPEINKAVLGSLEFELKRLSAI